MEVKVGRQPFINDMYKYKEAVVRKISKENNS